MKLLGFEVHNYAGLERQYIPLADKVHLLAGRNNSGKTALLQAVGALVISNYAAYRTADENRFSFVYRDDSQRSNFVRDTNGVLFHLDCVFKAEVVYDNLNQNPRIEKVDAITDDGHTYNVAFANSQGRVERRIYRRSGRELLFHQTQPGAADEASHIHGLFRTLQNVSYVDPHRKVHQGLNSEQHQHLPTDGARLAQFLATLQGNDYKRFGRIESAFLSCFPEYAKITLPLTSSIISIALIDRQSERPIPINQCGTGVEQVLVLLSCIIGADQKRLFLLDEPQDFLHPFLERRLMNIIFESEHQFLIATHSATMLNSVSASQITYIEKPGKSYLEYRQSPRQSGDILRHLGYKNSDLLFFDGVVFVEGPSDRELLPTLLRKAAPHAEEILRDICFCEIGGTGEYNDFDDMREDMIIQEKLILALHRRGIPHVYLLDGDKSPATERIHQMRPNGQSINVDFLSRNEIENYFLDAGAICRAINDERNEIGIPERVKPDEVQSELDQILSVSEADDKKLFEYIYKAGVGSRPRHSTPQGSRVLERLFQKFQMNYSKRRTGGRILDYLTIDEDAKLELNKTLNFISKHTAVEQLGAKS